MCLVLKMGSYGIHKALMSILVNSRDVNNQTASDLRTCSVKETASSVAQILLSRSTDYLCKLYNVESASFKLLQNRLDFKQIN